MNKYYPLFTALLSSFFTLAIIASLMLFFSPVTAAPSVKVKAIETPPAVITLPTYLSISALAFMPVNPNVTYNKDVNQQLLTLATPSRVLSPSNVFIAPLVLPDRSKLTGMTVFGQDFDNQGAVQVRLKRCDLSQAHCVNVVETTSTNSYAFGQFETSPLSLATEIVDNDFYTYFLELELTALTNSGLRAVRLEIVHDRSLTPPGNVEKWSLSGSVRNFTLPNTNLTEARVCTDDLSHLDNPTHYPSLIVDGRTVPLSSQACLIVQGRVIELRRDLNTGSSSGTYQFLR